jgi:GT2 family glycosyltransferase
LFSKVERDSGLPFVSVVVPTLNRKKVLDACLNSLSEMDYPKSRLEVIVVDGDSSDGTKEMLRTDFENVKLVIDRRPGISYARNTGGEVACGEIIAFTDDDCVVDRAWLRSLVTAFRNDKIGAAGGPAVLLRPDLFPTKFVESPTLGIYSLGDKECSAKFLVTANFSVRHKVFETVKFDVLFGRRNTLLYKWEEDVEFCQRLLDLGYELMYVPTAKVYHNVNPSRTAFKYIITKEFSGGLSHYMFERKHKARIVVGTSSLRSSVIAIAFFYKSRSIASFCWLLKYTAMVLASIFVP